jgi:hypothetical protein
VHQAPGDLAGKQHRHPLWQNHIVFHTQSSSIRFNVIQFALIGSRIQSLLALRARPPSDVPRYSMIF